jgi:hypothetical protein
MKPHVLVVDEVGYLAYGDDAANVLYHVVNDRHIRGRSMIFTTNKHPKRWGDGPSVRTKHLPDDELRIDVRMPCVSPVLPITARSRHGPVHDEGSAMG